MGRMLMVMQRPGAATGRLGERLQAQGHTLELCCPVAGESLPRSLDGYAGVVVFGGPMSANDKLPCIRAQLDWIPRALEAGLPFLGVCLGAQLLAKTLGGEIGPRDDGVAEIGYVPIRPTPAGAGLFDGPLTVYHWHQEGIRLPADAVLLAEGETFPTQAFRHGDRTYGLQFHPEVTRAMMEEWQHRAAESLDLPGAQSADQQRAGFERHDAALGRWLDGFLEHWLAS